MSYRYDRSLLEVNHETVQQLLDIAKEGGYARMTFVEPVELRTTRFQLNQLIAVLLHYHPEHKGLRPYLRTWTKYEGEEWALYVGKPSHNIAGPRPKTVNMGSIRKTAQESVDSTHYYHEKIVADSETLTAFGYALMNQSQGIRRVTMHYEHLDGVKLLEYLKETFPEWDYEPMGADRISLTRKVTEGVGVPSAIMDILKNYGGKTE